MRRKGGEIAEAIIAILAGVFEEGLRSAVKWIIKQWKKRKGGHRQEGT